MTDSCLQMPTLGDGWSWRLTRPVVPCTNTKCCGPYSTGHPKVFIELLLNGEVRNHATIDVEFYGDTTAVVNRAKAMVLS